MSREDKGIKAQFKKLFSEWEEYVKKPEVTASSNPDDYTDNEPYREIVRLGKEVLPFVLEKVEAGVFFMNRAALDILSLDIDSVIAEEMELPKSARTDFMAKESPQFLSEQQKSELILWAARRKAGRG